jgi:hypothetical protein
MGYLSMTFNKYSETKDVNIILDFERRLWSSLPYQKVDRYYKYRVVEEINDNIKKELKKYSYMPYKTLKSRYSIDDLISEEMIKARINSNYGKYFDKEVYLGKQHYFHLANFKNIYFNYIEKYNDDVLDLLKNNEDELNRLKIEATSKKLDMSWEDYKKFINGYIPIIFDNYTPMDDLIELGKWQPNNNLDWDEDNHIIKYFNKSLDGYILKYYDEQIGKRYKSNKKTIQCKRCERKIIRKSNRQCYCDYCSEYIKRKQKLENWNKNKHKYRK